MALNTELFGSPEQCREAGEWLSNTLAPAIYEAGSAIRRSRGRSDAVWHGQAAEAFRRLMADSGEDADELHEALQKGGRALTAFGDALFTARARRDQAREVAASAGLEVTPTDILPPGAEPGAAQQPPGSTAPVDDATPEDEAKHRAFREVQETMEQVRRDEKRAHDDLEDELKEPTSILDYLAKNWYWMSASAASSSAGGLHQAAETFKLRENAHTSLQSQWSSLYNDPSLTATERGRAGSAMMRHQARATAAQNALQNRALKLNETKAGGRALRAAHAYPSKSLVDSSTKLFARGSKAVLSKVPYVGAGITAFSTASAISQGKDKSEAVGTSASTYVTGALATAGAGLVLGSGGWAVLGAVGIGAAASAGVGYAIDNTGAKDFLRDAL